MVGDTGVVVPPNSPEAVAGAWNEVIAREGGELDEGRTVPRERIVQSFDTDRMVTMTETALAEIL